MRSLGVPARGGDIYDLALTHRSYAFEQPEPTDHNERLEFLGDAVLGVIVTELLYRTHPGLPEGELARLRASLVNMHALADLARSIGLGEHMRLGKGEEASGGRDKDSLLADSLEAVIGAVFLDRGMPVVNKALGPLLAARLQEVVAAGTGHDPKTLLQEIAVRNGGARPTYRIASSGPDHEKRFTARVYLDEELYGTGNGRSKKEAQQDAARRALERLDEREPAPEGKADARAS